MKSFLKTTAVVVLALVLTTIGWVAAIALGWLPVPAFVTDQVAQAKGLSTAESRTLNRAVNLYATLRQTPDAPVVDRALKMVADGVRDDQSWVQFAKEVYPRLSPTTLTRVRDQLQMDAADFDAGKAVFDQVFQATGDGLPQLTDRQAEVLRALDAKYHLVETFAKLQ